MDIVADGFDLGVRESAHVPSDMIALALGSPQRFAAVGAPGYFETHMVLQVPTNLLQHPRIRVRLPDRSL